MDRPEDEQPDAEPTHRITFELDTTTRITLVLYPSVGSLELGVALERLLNEGATLEGIFAAGLIELTNGWAYHKVWRPNPPPDGDDSPSKPIDSPLLDAGYSPDQIYRAGVDALLARPTTAASEAGATDVVTSTRDDLVRAGILVATSEMREGQTVYRLAPGLSALEAKTRYRAWLREAEEARGRYEAWVRNRIEDV